MKPIIPITAFFSGMLLMAYHVPKEVEVIKEIPAVRQSFDNLIASKASDYGFSPTLIEGIISQESSRDVSNTKSKFEPRIFEKLQNRPKSTSWGTMQVMGYHATDTCGFNTVEDIVGPENIENNLDCGLQILADCRQWVDANPKFRSLSKKDKLSKTLSCYNGSSTYPKTIISRIGEFVFNQL